MVSSELRNRLITGAILIGVFTLLDLAAVYLSFGRILLSAVGLAAVGICGFEVSAFTFKNRPKLQYVLAAILTISPLLAFVASLGCSSMTGIDCGAAPFAGAVALGAAGLFLFIALLARSSLSAVLQAVATAILGFLLIGVGGSSLLSIGLSAQGGALIAWLVIVVGVNDIAAFLCGGVIGGPKLAPAISPGKTISGGIGGVVLGAAAGGASRALLTPGTSWLLSLAVGILVTVAAQNGDLMKSILKRLWGAKDSGNILPGHGGVLDRIDGLLGGALILYVALQTGLFHQP